MQNIDLGVVGALVDHDDELLQESLVNRFEARLLME
jgi:hypothetical protein